MTSLNNSLLRKGSLPHTRIKFIKVFGALISIILITSVPTTPNSQAAFPGDNGKIAFDTNRDSNEDIYVMDADGANPTRLTNDSSSDHGSTWSPDGTKIAFHSSRDGNFEIYVMNANGTGQTRLTNNPTIDNSAAWSPDGTKIIFNSSRDGNSEIYVMNADGTGQTNLTNHSAEDSRPAWSPDGAKIAFQSNRDGDFEIHVMNTDGTGQVSLTNNSAHDEGVNWSADSAKIAFTSDRDGNFENYVMNADGTGQTNLTNNAAHDDGAKWSPDGTKIVFRSVRDGNSEIYVMNSNGSGQTNITNNSAEDVRPDWQPLPIADTTPPVITPNISGLLGSNDWYISDVTVTWSVTDPESGIAASTGCDPATLTTDTTGVTLTCSATNGVGLSNSASTTIKLDKTVPAVTIIAPANGSTILLNAAVVSDYSCSDATSGVAVCNGPVPSGSNIDTGSVGSKSFTVNATDQAGLNASVTHTYNVTYNFSGFFAPVDNPPALNVVNSGQAIPIKFSLSGNQGLNIFEAGYPKSQQITCDSSLPLAPVEETVTAGSSSLSYNANSNQYIYVWKTEKSWAKTCRQLIVKLSDGTSHLANFQFSK